MVRELERKSAKVDILEKSAPCFHPIFFRSYSRKKGDRRESFSEAIERALSGLIRLGRLQPEEEAILRKNFLEIKALPSGRWLWIGGTPWSEKPENYSGAYNCTSLELDDLQVFGLLMDLAMQGCGTGAMLESRFLDRLPAITTRLEISLKGEIGEKPAPERLERSLLERKGSDSFRLIVGDSRQGWVEAYQALLDLAIQKFESPKIMLEIDLSSIRPAGEPLKGFGGTANPIKLPDLFFRAAKILNQAQGRKLNSLEACLLIDEAALTVVAGNIRRSAGMRQGSSEDMLFAQAKKNLWKQTEDGSWQIDPDRDALRMANHTRVFHHKPSLEEIEESIRSQYYSGEGAIQWAGEAVARANCDLITDKKTFLKIYNQSREAAREFLRSLAPQIEPEELEHRLNRYGLNPCGEIIGSNFHCNLAEIHLNRLDPQNWQEQEEAFKAGALAAAILLQHKFIVPRFQRSRELDPIVGVSFTGLFDFFVAAFGIDWLRWWAEGRPESAQGKEFKQKEAEYLQRWKKVVHEMVWDYCDRHGLKRPNRCTTVQPAGTKSLLTNASPGWHPPKAVYYLRRITFAKEDPIALACLDYGYSITPSQSDKDATGRLLEDPFDPRVTEWLVEIPVAVPWADLPGAEEIDPNRFSALAQFDFYLQVQQHYTAHNTSATLELRESEISALAKRIHQAIVWDEGYSSCALLARFDDHQSFPRLPFEPISREKYLDLQKEISSRQKESDFQEALRKRDLESLQKIEAAGPAACDSDRCLGPVENTRI
jgi:ribonucleotide reductase class II